MNNGTGLGRQGLVKNKTAAAIQITAEQLIREAVDRQAAEHRVKPVSNRILDGEELKDYTVRRRKEFEDKVRRQSQLVGEYIKYAEWEATLKEFTRARSVYERALNVDYRNVTTWRKYLDMEVKNKHLMHARNLYERVTTILPRVDQFWYRYAHLEELLGNYVGARSVFEKWMKIEPETSAWLLYVKFEERCGEIELARAVFERLLDLRPTVEHYEKFIHFEERNNNVDGARSLFHRAIATLTPLGVGEEFLIKLSQFEERHQRVDEAGEVLKMALDELGKAGMVGRLGAEWIAFNKKHAGDVVDVEAAVLVKRRALYEQTLGTAPLDVDSWLNLIKLEMNLCESLIQSLSTDVSTKATPLLAHVSSFKEDKKILENAVGVKKEILDSILRIRRVFADAVKRGSPCNVGGGRKSSALCADKSLWKRFAHIFIQQAHFEEMIVGDTEEARNIWDSAVSHIFEKSEGKVSFAKLFILWAEFEIRQGDISKVRKVLGLGIAKCGKNRIFEFYAELEMRIGDMNRVRNVLSKFIEVHPYEQQAWLSMLEFEEATEEYDRVRALFELAIGGRLPEGIVSGVEGLFQKWVEFEKRQNCWDKASALYERILVQERRTSDFKVWKLWLELAMEQLQMNWKKITSTGGEIDIPYLCAPVRRVVFLAEEGMKIIGNDEARAALRSFWMQKEERIFEVTGEKDGLLLAKSCLPEKVIKVKRVRDDEFVRLGEDGVEETADGTVIRKESAWVFIPLPITSAGVLSENGVTPPSTSAGGADVVNSAMDEEEESKRKKAEMLRKAREWKLKRQQQQQGQKDNEGDNEDGSDSAKRPRNED